MEQVAQRNFHLIMAGLLLGILILDQNREHLAFWSPPMVSGVSLALAGIWLWHALNLRIRKLQQSKLVLEDRMQRAERKIDGLEQELLLLRRRPLDF